MPAKKIIIRFERIGRYKAPLYNVVVVKGNKKHHTKFYSKIGLYVPLYTNRFFFMNLKELSFWLSRGAQIRGRLSKLIINLLSFN
jgi:ribosomal protein S16|uniref:Ribosomal protein S16 n=1 Tax=Vermamoeba vermiformis TaxID=5778 RepID=D4PBM4_VERVE|nr:ribosomal protein S16 [Vermamoeba vermiformis]ADD62236.1 ribosomal protein S16 [Vermamoeba vermiformis]